MKRRQEKATTSSRILLNLLQTHGDYDKKLLILDDLLWKSKNLPPEYRHYLVVNALKCFVPSEIAARFKEQESDAMIKKPINVAIMTVKRPELLAAKVAFEIDLAEEETRYVNGLRYWETSIVGGSDVKDLDVVLTMVAEDGNLSCAAACGRLFSTYDIGLCVLVGFAAGVKEKTRLGDVVAADLIIDYEKARLEPDGRKKRPVPYSLETRIARDLEYFDPVRFGWKEAFSNAFNSLRADPHGIVPKLDAEFEPQFISGVILSGEKLIANGTIDSMREDYHDRTCAAEMEGAGFARLCEEHGVPWVVFRGISDYGDIEKSDLWQSTSALSATTAAKIFVTKGYKWPESTV